MIQRIVVFNGVKSDVINAIFASLEREGTRVVRVTREKHNQAEYYAKLVEALLSTVNHFHESDDVIVYTLLVSGLDEKNPFANDGEYEVELRSFFPSVRRLQITDHFKSDWTAWEKLREEIYTVFRTWEDTRLHKICRSRNGSPALFPLRNFDDPDLFDCLIRIYNLQTDRISRNIDKKVVWNKEKRAFEAYGVTLKGAINDLRHPVQRHTNSVVCDLNAKLRLGHRIFDRFEFDIDENGKLPGRTFCLCDGAPKSVVEGARHINMRINDDFG